MDSGGAPSYGDAVTSADPQRSGRPDDKTVVVPTGGATGQPPPQAGQYPPTARYPPAQYPSGYAEQPTTHLAYNPYGQQFPAVEQYPQGYPMPEPARRPAGMVVALLLHLLSALPFLAGAAALIAGSASVRSMLPADQLAEFEQLTGVDPFAVLYGFAAFLGVVALLFLLFAVLAFVRRNVARVLVTLMTLVFVVLTGLAVFAGLAGGVVTDPSLGGTGELVGGLIVLAAPALLALVGTILLFTPAANRFYRTRRR